MAEELSEHDRREAALAAAPILQPGFKPSKVTQAQIDKFKELQQRRLLLKCKYKGKRKPEGSTSEGIETCMKVIEDGSGFKLATNEVKPSNPSSTEGTKLLKRRKKLHWGLEAKQRWERKANM
ncbi:hypothetical protein HPP92_011204 [Vanilla planifolia]|uniref:Uncharacterized protein n=1 Tax=Vanilla planifolia TaxID=51239 RepID=A0A835R7Z6_VANPL|nr:hypothetical protein HPP92_011524 [Vanilla planifolia]KAG0483120.1 hypothetical protein HPP92_011204 [Vanilla planifolia]